MALQLTDTARENLEPIQQALEDVRDDLKWARELEARSPDAKVMGSATADSILILSHILHSVERALKRADKELLGQRLP